MSGYRCYFCRNKLQANALFCPKCERFFDAPVPDGDPGSSRDNLYGCPNGAGRNVRSGLYGALAFVALVLIGTMFVADRNRSGTGNTHSGMASGADILASVAADADATRSGSHKARQSASDRFMELVVHGRVRHTNAAAVNDIVTIRSLKKIDRAHALLIAEYAAHTFSDIRSQSMPYKDAMKLRVIVCDPRGNRMNAIRASDYDATGRNHAVNVRLAAR